MSPYSFRHPYDCRTSVRIRGVSHPVPRYRLARVPMGPRRPYIRSLFDIDFSPRNALESNDYRNEVIEKLHASVSIIIGAVRDSYMLLTQGTKPTLPKLLNDANHQTMKGIANKEHGIKGFIQQESKNILAALDEKNTPRLLEVFSKEDVKDMKEQVMSNF